MLFLLFIATASLFFLLGWSVGPEISIRFQNVKGTKRRIFKPINKFDYYTYEELLRTRNRLQIDMRSYIEYPSLRAMTRTNLREIQSLIDWHEQVSGNNPNEIYADE